MLAGDKGAVEEFFGEVPTTVGGFEEGDTHFGGGGCGGCGPDGLWTGECS